MPIGISILQQLIKDFETSCINWNSQPTNIKFVFNEALKKVQKNNVKYILVADNPGIDESAKSEYLIGKAGLVTRLFFDSFLVDNFDDEVLVLNKTPIFTPKTDDLKSLHVKQCRVFLNSQLYMADLIYNLSVKLDVPVIIMGFAGCRASNGRWNLETKAEKAVGLAFYKQLALKFKNNSENIFIVKHFSRNLFFDDFNIDSYRSCPKTHFFTIGAKYRGELFGT